MLPPNVFVVDDDQASQQVLCLLAESAGYRAAGFSTAEEFLQSYSGERPSCLFCDQRMPGMSGIELLERLNELMIPIPVVLITAFADISSTVRAVRGGAINLLQKPCRRSEILQAMKEAIEKDIENLALETERNTAIVRVRSLTESETEVAQLLLQGLPNKVVASRLDIGLRTVEAKRSAIMKKLEVNSIAELVQTWLQAHGKI